MNIGQLLPSLSGVRKGGQGYVAMCPAHDDRKASLSLAEGDGRILIKCFAGCRTEEIVGRLGLKWRDLFDREITKPSQSTLGQSRSTMNVKFKSSSWYAGRSGGQVHCVYPYVDESGRLQYENVRFYPKDFRQRRYDASGQAVWNLEGVKRVPYRLPELIEAAKAGTDIFLCEGEKDADALRELGFTASSFKNWNEDFNRYIEGVNVIIVVDHDHPGMAQAGEAARVVLRSAASVKLLDMWLEQELPDKNGRDISDYIKHCVEVEGMDWDSIKERICLAIDNTENWKDTRRLRTEDYFVVQSGNEWMSQSKSQRIPEKLFGEFWFENEVCILFADTNVGKSILAVQIADQISRGGANLNSPPYKGGVAAASADGVVLSSTGEVQPELHIDSVEENHPPTEAAGPLLRKEGSLRCTVAAQKVVYFDFELTAKQFESRFSEREEGSDVFVNHYQFHRNFYRAEINPETSDIGEHDKFEDFLNASLEQTIVGTGAKVIIIDNLTYLRDETENARNALPLMKYLKKLKSKHGLSILALAHTPKRDSTKPLGRNDLQGSKMLINFCDSSFAIGESSKQPGLRYLKQIKARNAEIVFHTENVLMATVSKEANFLHFNFHETAAEYEHLKVISNKQRDEMKDQVKKLSEEGLSTRKIAAKLGISAMTVGRYLKV